MFALAVIHGYSTVLIYVAYIFLRLLWHLLRLVWLTPTVVRVGCLRRLPHKLLAGSVSLNLQPLIQWVGSAVDRGPIRLLPPSLRRCRCRYRDRTQ